MRARYIILSYSLTMRVLNLKPGHFFLTCTELCRKLNPHRLAYIVLEGTMHITGGGSNHQFYTAGNPVYYNDRPVKTCP